MKNINSNFQNQVIKRNNKSRISTWLKHYRWHFAVWFGFFLYGYITDLLLYSNAYFWKVLVHFLTHHVLLFYSLLYCLNSFSPKPTGKMLLGIFRFVFTIGAFLLLRLFLNYKVFPLMDDIMGYPREELVLSNLNIGGLFWISEISVRVLAYFIFKKLLASQKQNFQQQIQLRNKEGEEQRARQAEENLKQLELTFINLVHETKTPITLINNYISDHIELHGSSEELEIVRNNVRKLSRDVTNLFDLERFRHGVEMFDHDQRVDFSGLLDTAYEQFAVYSHKRGIRLSRCIEQDVLITADPLALTRIANNLVENAIRYSPADTEISLTLNTSGAHLVFAVADQGLGIDPEDLADIFTPYHLLHKNKKNDQGMGLGLPMVKNIVDSLDGEISIKNGEREGTVVTVILPVGEKKPFAEMTRLEPGLGIIEEKEPFISNSFAEDAPLLLVVEDNADLNSYLVRKLGQRYNVRAAANGAEAINLLQREVPDLIISDVMMDHMDGFAFAETLQGSPAWSHVPIIFLTARATEVDKMRGLALGAIDYMVKPFAMEELLKKAEALLSYTNRREQRLIEDLYRTTKQMKRKGNPISHEETTLAPVVNTFETKCRDAGLTKREVEITLLLMEGKTNKVIAETIFISLRTVETHIRNVYEKLQVSNKIELLKQLQ